MIKNIFASDFKKISIIGLTVVFIISGFFVNSGTALAARTIYSVTLNDSSSVIVLPNTSIIVDITVKTTVSDHDWKSTKYQIEGQSAECVNTTDHTSSNTFTESFSITSPSSLGAYDVTFVVYQNNNCSGNSNTFTLTDGITVANYSGPNSPSTGTNDNSIGSSAWTNPGRIVSSNNKYATAVLNSNGEITDYLKATDFGFSIPLGSTIDGIQVSIEKFEGGFGGNTYRLRDYSVRLVKAGVIGTINKANTIDNWPSSDTNTYTNYGGQTDTWGDTWSVSNINSSNFGVVFAAKCTTCGDHDRTPSIDHIRITVYYTATPTDTTPPVITKTISGTSGTNDWYTSDVTVTWTVIDSESAVIIDSDCVTQNFTSETAGTLSSCSAHSTGGSISDSVTVKMDKSGPSANLSVTAGTMGNDGWYVSDVTVETTGSDSISSPVVCTADQFQTAETTGAEFNGSCTNDAGLKTDASPIIVKLDKTAPTVVSVDSDGEIYTTNTVSPHPIKITFSEDVINTPSADVHSVFVDSPFITDCGDADAKTFCFAYTIPTLQEMNHEIYITGAQDAAGNIMILDNSHTFTVDTKSPTLIFNDDVEAGPVMADNIAIDYGDSSIKKYGFVSSSGDCVSSMDVYGFINYTENFLIDNLSHNATYICAYGEDAVGNKTVSVSDNDLNVDSVIPAIVVLNPGTNPSQSKTITATTNLAGIFKMSETSGDYCGSDMSYVDYASITYTLESDNNIKVCYQVIDEQGNEAYEMSDPIGGINTTAPVISLNESATVDLTVGDLYADAGATASDDIDGVITDSIITVNPVNTAVVGTYTVTYNVSDTALNSAIEVTRTVNVNAAPPVSDTTAPVITLDGSNPMNLTVGSTFTDPGATALDDIDGSVAVIASGSVDTATVGAYTITYTATDAALNIATETRTVNVNAVILVNSTSGGGTYYYYISASAGSNGSINPIGSADVASGGSQTYTISPNTGYQVADVLIDGVSDGPITTYTFSNVTASHTISATFSAVPASTVAKIGDFNGDNKVDQYDFAMLMAHWDEIMISIFDLNNDGKVDKDDLIIFISNWSL